MVNAQMWFQPATTLVKSESIEDKAEANAGASEDRRHAVGWISEAPGAVTALTEPGDAQSTKHNRPKERNKRRTRDLKFPFMFYLPVED
jgi:hypothetical protein